VHIVVHPRLNEIDADQWNAMLPGNNPFMRHEFLEGLEASHCVSQANGWEPAHIAVYQDQSKNKLIGAMPCYIKDHSYGEYIFDWSWADAHRRHGLEYYPKLCNAVPFTPATGERWLIAEGEDFPLIAKQMIAKALEVVDERNLSSFHSLFLTETQFGVAQEHSLLGRHSSQFHWENRGYQEFSDFLAQLSSKKRKNIKRERRRVHETGIVYRWLSGDQLNEQAVDKMYAFYSRTIAYYGAQSYLNKDFFKYLGEFFNQQTLFLFAEYDNQVIAGGLYFKSDDTLYGRYWGALDNFHSVHFETCYYQAIEWCIANGYQRFEAGAQGEHKLARGLEPHTTYSAHWISHPQFRDAIATFLIQEKDHIEHYSNAMQAHSPFKQEI
jgi:predicted N-acyltransferase